MPLKTHCSQGHEFTVENTKWVNYYRKPGDFRRRCRICFAAKFKVHRRNPTEHVVRKMFAGLANGFTISHLTMPRERPADCDIRVGHEKWQGIKAKLPKIAARIIKLSIANRKLRLEERRRLYRVEAPAIVHRRIVDIWQLVQSLVPAHWSEDKRSETIARVGLELSDGRCAPTGAAIRAAIQRASTDHNRMFSEWAMGGGSGKWVSLDAPRWEDGSTTVGDTVSQGLWA